MCAEDPCVRSCTGRHKTPTSEVLHQDRKPIGGDKGANDPHLRIGKDGKNLEVVHANGQEGQVHLLLGQEVAGEAAPDRHHHEQHNEHPREVGALQALPTPSVVPEA